MKNIFLNDIIKHNDYKRYDFITQSLILLIEKEDLNKTYKWIDYNIFNKYLKLILNMEHEINNVENYIKKIQFESGGCNFENNEIIFNKVNINACNNKVSASNVK